MGCDSPLGRNILATIYKLYITIQSGLLSMGSNGMRDMRVSCSTEPGSPGLAIMTNRFSLAWIYLQKSRDFSRRRKTGRGHTLCYGCRNVREASLSLSLSPRLRDSALAFPFVVLERRRSLFFSHYGQWKTEVRAGFIPTSLAHGRGNVQSKKKSLGRSA